MNTIIKGLVIFWFGVAPVGYVVLLLAPAFIARPAAPVPVESNIEYECDRTGDMECSLDELLDERSSSRSETTIQNPTRVSATALE